MSNKTSRRGFLRTSVRLGLAAATIGTALETVVRSWGRTSGLNIGVIGVGGRGAADLAGVASQNIVAPV